MRHVTLLSYPGKAGQVWKTVRQLSSGLANIFYPAFCNLCDKKLSAVEEIVCDSCWAKLEPTHLGNRANQITHRRALDCVFSGWFFNDTFQGIIHCLKYDEKHVLARHLATRLAKMFIDEFADINIEVMVPVPLHPARLRDRGFNQSDLLARPLSQQLGITYDPTLLHRRKNTVSQTTLSLKERKRNMHGAFSAKDLSGRTRVLIIDDVVTSGATVSSCAQVLREKGAKFIAVLTAGTPYLEAGKSLQVKSANKP